MQRSASDPETTHSIPGDPDN